MSDFAAPTAKWAASETMAEAMMALYPVMKKNGMMGIMEPTAVESAPEMAEVMGLLRASSVELRRSLAMALRNWSGSLAR